MKIELKRIPVRDLVEGYEDNEELGVRAYDGKLDVRPPYQREFVYKDKQRDAVIATRRRASDSGVARANCPFTPSSITRRRSGSPDTIGTPDFIIVASWRLKKATSLGVTGLPAAPNSGLGFTLTTEGVVPCLRSSARRKLAFLDDCSPFILTPRLSVPSQTNMDSWLVLRSTGTVFFAALLVTAIRFPPISRIPTPGTAGRLVDGNRPQRYLPM